jgi:hypothetical protein
MQMLLYAFRGLEMPTPKKVCMDRIAGKPVDFCVTDKKKFILLLDYEKAIF